MGRVGLKKLDEESDASCSQGPGLLSFLHWAFCLFNSHACCHKALDIVLGLDCPGAVLKFLPGLPY